MKQHERMPDPEEVQRVIAQLRMEHPHAPLSRICDLINWPALRRSGETYEEFHSRHFGPAEPLP